MKLTVKPLRDGREWLRGTLAPWITLPDLSVRISATMLKALRLGLFIGTLIGASACAVAPAGQGQGGWYGSGDVGRTERN